jgi:anaerobic selenocysteine-containing dehydrogenase
VTYNKKTLNRRDFNKTSAVALMAATLGTLGANKMASAQTPASQLESTYLMELALDVADQLDAGHTRIAPVTGGSFSGPRVKGTVRDSCVTCIQLVCYIQG